MSDKKGLTPKQIKIYDKSTNREQTQTSNRPLGAWKNWHRPYSKIY